MKKHNCFIHLLLFLLWIPLFSCNSHNSDFDDRVRNHFYQSNSYFKNYIIDSIRYDTIGTGQWSYNLATLMIDHPDLFSDKGLLDELVLMLNDIDTTDCRIRLIANVYGRGFVYYIGVIGDSLTNLEEKLPFSDAPIEAILNICSPTEKRILDIANVIELSDRRISSFLNKTLLSILSNDYSVHCFSKTPPIFNAKGHTKDTTLRLQFTGVYLNDNIDSVILMHPTIIKEFSYDNYSRYYLKNKIETRSGVHKLDTHIYTIKNRIVLIKSVCNDEIVGELYELFKAKYGEDVSVYSYDETFLIVKTGLHYIFGVSQIMVLS